MDNMDNMSKLQKRIKEMKGAVKRLNETKGTAAPLIIPEELFGIKALLRRKGYQEAMLAVDAAKSKSRTFQHLLINLRGLHEQIARYNADPNIMFQIGDQLLLEYYRLNDGKAGLRPGEAEVLRVITEAIGQHHEGFAKNFSMTDARLAEEAYV